MADGIKIFRRLRQLKDVLFSPPGTPGHVLTLQADGETWAPEASAGGGGGAPVGADYLVGTADPTLTNEIVVGPTPGGELGGTWGAITVDAVHSGSSHAAVQADAEATAAAALAAHEADTTAVHGIADTANLILEGDARLTDSRDPNAHATTHADGGGDEITTALDPRAYPLLADTLANRPAFGVAGRFFWTTDEGILYRDSGTAWIKVAVSDYPDLDDIPATFAPSAHASSHQDGGADEISIAGLAGTPLELTNHLNDATDAHDASAVSVLDSGAFYTATDVEGVLAEIAPQLGGSDWDATIRKSADESVISSTTLQDDNELQFSVDANAAYFFELLLVYNSGGTGDIKHAFALAAGAFVRSWRNHDGLGPTTAIAQTGVVTNMTDVIVNAGTLDDVLVRVVGYFVVDTATTLKLQWAQNASEAVNTTVKAGSLLRYRKMV